MKNIKIPKYSLGEELINSISHGIGAAMGIAALVLTLIASAKSHSTIGIISSCVYGISMIIMYLISCLYHSFSPKIKAKKVFRILDHCDIYVFIAGCYTPYCLNLIGGKEGWIVFGIVWSLAIIGILLNSINLEKFKVISFILYLAMGWVAAFSLDSISSAIAKPGLILLVAGGVVYTIGAILYMIGSKKKYFHSVFHFFILAASVLQFLSIYLYVL